MNRLKVFTLNQCVHYHGSFLSDPLMYLQFCLFYSIQVYLIYVPFNFIVLGINFGTLTSDIQVLIFTAYKIKPQLAYTSCSEE